MLVMYVMFRDVADDAWYKIFLKKGFGHSSILIENGPRFILLDPLSTHIGIRLFAKKGIEKTLTELEDRTILKISAILPDLKHFISWPRTCATTVQYILGKNLGCITPYGLYKKLTGKYKDIFATEIIKRQKND